MRLYAFVCFNFTYIFQRCVENKKRQSDISAFVYKILLPLNENSEVNELWIFVNTNYVKILNSAFLTGKSVRSMLKKVLFSFRYHKRIAFPLRSVVVEHREVLFW